MTQGVEEGEHPPIIAVQAGGHKKKRPCLQGRLQSRHDCCVAV
ncbi:Hypothetical protein EPM1_1059 [Stenotrophomonas maltophilia EPM1]|nr:Hypothetical protein EPM1_1059 [Stenotrophomonas maltophilia EPM1]